MLTFIKCLDIKQQVKKAIFVGICFAHSKFLDDIHYSNVLLTGKEWSTLWELHLYELMNMQLFINYGIYLSS